MPFHRYNTSRMYVYIIYTFIQSRVHVLPGREAEMRVLEGVVGFVARELELEALAGEEHVPERAALTIRLHEQHVLSCGDGKALRKAPEDMWLYEK